VKEIGVGIGVFGLDEMMKEHSERSS